MALAFKSGLWVSLFDFDERSRKKNCIKSQGEIHLKLGGARATQKAAFRI